MGLSINYLIVLISITYEHFFIISIHKDVQWKYQCLFCKVYLTFVTVYGNLFSTTVFNQGISFKQNQIEVLELLDKAWNNWGNNTT